MSNSTDRAETIYFKISMHFFNLLKMNDQTQKAIINYRSKQEK